MRNKNWLHVRIESDLAEKLDNFARDTGVTKSIAARALLYEAFNDEERAATVSRAFYTFHGAVTRTVRKLASELSSRLPEMIADELDE